MEQPAYKHIVIITGAGISAESGIPTFRGPKGAYMQYNVRDIAYASAYRNNPEYVHQAHNAGRAIINDAQPNAAHEAIAELMARYPGKVTLISQNVDDMHQTLQRQIPPRPGSALIPLHGEIKYARWRRWNEDRKQWEDTDRVQPWSEPMTPETIAPYVPTFDAATRAKYERDGPQSLYAAIRPDVVWFDEIITRAQETQDALDDCDLCVVVGSSGQVPSSAGLIDHVRKRNIPVIDLNVEPVGYADFTHMIRGKATQLVPEIVRQLLDRKDVIRWADRMAALTNRDQGPREH